MRRAHEAQPAAHLSIVTKREPSAPADARSKWARALCLYIYWPDAAELCGVTMLNLLACERCLVLRGKVFRPYG